MGDPSHNAKRMSSDRGEGEIGASSPSQQSKSPSSTDLEQTPTPGSKAPFHSQYPSNPLIQPSGTSGMIPTSQGPQVQSSSQQQPSQLNPYAMSSMANALPDHSNSPVGQQFQAQYQQSNARPLAGASTPAVVYQLQQNLQYPHHGSPVYGSPGPYGYVQQFHGGYGQSPGHQTGVYGAFMPPQQRQGPMQHGGHPYQHGTMQYYYYQDPYGRQTGTPPQFIPPGNQYAGPYTSGEPQVVSSSQMSDGNTNQQFSGISGFGGSTGATMSPSNETFANRRSSQEPSGGNTIPRGPPRKPKQSGHALWVGNLPPGATVWDLKDHFSRDATKDIESLFLISKSNCAFVNYRSEAACTAAMQRFHDSRFQGVRLVCRLRRSSAQSSGIPVGPSSMTSRRTSEASPHKSPNKSPSKSPNKSPTLEESDDPEEEEQPTGDPLETISTSPTRTSERYFIVKSLTLQDLEQSVRNGVWATQAHNEETLNNAYQAADNVYLIFSANKSGEYFGYARMASAISENAEEIFGIIPRSEVNEPADAPKSIPTPATEFAPKGHVIDDSARGTIFWEAEHSDDDEEVDLASDTADMDESEPGSQTWGKPFKVEWMSTTRLPFYRTRGLRNPWNANREVKIARDGTELEPGVGKRLVQLFHRIGQAPSTTSTTGPNQTSTSNPGSGQSQSDS